MTNFINVAKKYISKGISVIPTDEVKRSVIPWKQYQEGIMSPQWAEEIFNSQKVKGIAIICGAVSGNLEVIDFDTKYDITSNLYEEYCRIIKEHNTELFNKLLVIQTKSGGFHWYYKCEVIEGNQKLAQRPCTEEEKKNNPNVTVQVLIETRGEKGYVIAPPTEGYTKISGSEIPVISFDERELLLDLARSFDEVVEIAERHPTSAVDHKQYGLSPFEDFNQRGDVEQYLQAHGWTYDYERGPRRFYIRPGKSKGDGISGDYHSEKRLFKAFTSSSNFVQGKGYMPYQVFSLLECNNDFSLAAKKLSELNFGEKRVGFGSMEREVFKRKMDGMNRGEIKTYLVKNFNLKSDEDADEALSTMERQWGETLCTFWEIDKNRKLSISRYKLKTFLSEIGGFGLYFYDKGSNIFKIVRVQNGLVEEASTEQLKRFIEDYVKSLPECFDGGITQQELLEVVYKGADAYFNKSFLEFLDRKEISFLKDTATEAFFPFRNGVVVVTKDDIQVKTYGELKKSIWRTQIIDFDIDIIKTIDIEDAEYCKFVQKIAADDQSRIQQAFGLIGYTLHKYKDETKPFAVILAEETEDEAKGGGTGKGLFFKGISKLINVVFIDGKTMDLNKSFAWQRVGLDTQLIVIEDCRKNVDFEGFYSKITEGLTVEKKNKDEIYLGYEDAPKFGFTTNYSITLKGNHGKRRGKIIEFSDFFHPGQTPEDYFKHKLFSGWDRDEWNRFYNFMFWCVSYYLLGGIHEINNSQTLKRKQIKLNYGEEFIDWWDGYVSNGCYNWKQFKDLHSNFLNESDQEKKNFSAKRFTRAVEDACSSFGYKYEKNRNRQNNSAVEVRVLKPGVHDVHDKEV